MSPAWPVARDVRRPAATRRLLAARLRVLVPVADGAAERAVVVFFFVGTAVFPIVLPV